LPPLVRLRVRMWDAIGGPPWESIRNEKATCASPARLDDQGAAARRRSRRGVPSWAAGRRDSKATGICIEIDQPWLSRGKGAGMDEPGPSGDPPTKAGTRRVLILTAGARSRTDSR
jgi:hypothetical protein